MGLSNVQAAITGLVTAVASIAVSLGLVSNLTAQALVGAAGIIVPAVFVLVVAIENHAKAKPVRLTPLPPAGPAVSTPVAAPAPVATTPPAAAA